MASKNGNGNGKKAPPSAAVNLIGTSKHKITASEWSEVET